MKRLKLRVFWLNPAWADAHRRFLMLCGSSCDEIKKKNKDPPQIKSNGNIVRCLDNAEKFKRLYFPPSGFSESEPFWQFKRVAVQSASCLFNNCHGRVRQDGGGAGGGGGCEPFNIKNHKNQLINQPAKCCSNQSRNQTVEQFSNQSSTLSIDQWESMAWSIGLMCSRHTLGLLLLKTALQHSCNLKHARQQSIYRVYMVIYSQWNLVEIESRRCQ